MAAVLPPTNVPDLLRQAAAAIANVEKHRQAMREVAAEVKTTPKPAPAASAKQ
jgi:hypothetical protein